MNPQSVLLGASLYREVVTELGIADTRVSPESKSCSVRSMCAENAWLPKFMLKTDELAMVMTGARIWNSAYIADHESFLGFRVQDIDDETVELIDATYSQVPVIENCPFSLKKKIAMFAVTSSIEIVDGFAKIEPLRGYYNIQGTPEHGSIIPLPLLTLLQCHELNRMIASISQKRTIEFCLARARSRHDAPAI